LDVNGAEYVPEMDCCDYCLSKELLRSMESLCSLWLVSVLCGLTVQGLCSCEFAMQSKKIVDSFKVPSESYHLMKFVVECGVVPSREIVVDCSKLPSHKVGTVLVYRLGKSWAV
jgi:hypothetical protein